MTNRRNALVHQVIILFTMRPEVCMCVMVPPVHIHRVSFANQLPLPGLTQFTHTGLASKRKWVLYVEAVCLLVQLLSELTAAISAKLL